MSSITNLVNEYFNKLTETIKFVDKENIQRLAQLLLSVYENENTVFVFGNGGSGATASHLCADLIKGVSCGLEKRFKAICLNDNVPALLAIANDDSYSEIFVEQLKNFLKPKDLVIGISGSGNSQNVVKAMEYAKTVGATTIALCGYDGGVVKRISDLSVHANVENMEITEDVHSIVAHCIKSVLVDTLKPRSVYKSTSETLPKYTR